MPWMLLTRRGCHLCEIAEDAVAVHRPDTETVDVDADDALRARYGLRVPVLLIDGTIALEGRIAEAEVARLAADRSDA